MVRTRSHQSLKDAEADADAEQNREPSPSSPSAFPQDAQEQQSISNTAASTTTASNPAPNPAPSSIRAAVYTAVYNAVNSAVYRAFYDALSNGAHVDVEGALAILRHYYSSDYHSHNSTNASANATATNSIANAAPTNLTTSPNNTTTGGDNLARSPDSAMAANAPADNPDLGGEHSNYLSGIAHRRHARPLPTIAQEVGRPARGHIPPAQADENASSSTRDNSGGDPAASQRSSRHSCAGECRLRSRPDGPDAQRPQVLHLDARQNPQDHLSRESPEPTGLDGTAATAPPLQAGGLCSSCAAEGRTAVYQPAPALGSPGALDAAPVTVDTEEEEALQQHQSPYPTVEWQKRPEPPNAMFARWRNRFAFPRDAAPARSVFELVENYVTTSPAGVDLLREREAARANNDHDHSSHHQAGSPVSARSSRRLSGQAPEFGLLVEERRRPSHSPKTPEKASGPRKPKPAKKKTPNKSSASKPQGVSKPSPRRSPRRSPRLPKI